MYASPSPSLSSSFQLPWVIFLSSLETAKDICFLVSPCDFFLPLSLLFFLSGFFSHHLLSSFFCSVVRAYIQYWCTSRDAPQISQYFLSLLPLIFLFWIDQLPIFEQVVTLLPLSSSPLGHTGEGELLPPQIGSSFCQAHPLS